MNVTIRTDLRPGDIGAIVRFHGLVYAEECGFDHTFEAYVAGPLGEFAQSISEREHVWIGESEGRLAGCIAIVESEPGVAQLRWYLVDPDFRGQGLGRRLLSEALEFCRACGYRSVFLYTVGMLKAAAHLYRSVGFRRVEAKRARLWGVDVIDERYELLLN